MEPDIYHKDTIYYITKIGTLVYAQPWQSVAWTWVEVMNGFTVLEMSIPIQWHMKTELKAAVLNLTENSHGKWCWGVFGIILSRVHEGSSAYVHQEDKNVLFYAPLYHSGSKWLLKHHSCYQRPCSWESLGKPLLMDVMYIWTEPVTWEEGLRKRTLCEHTRTRLCTHTHTHK